MEQARSTGFVRNDTLTVQPFAPGFFRIEGEIACRGDIVIAVTKTLKVVRNHGNEALVQTNYYAYNAHVRGFKTFLRNDNAHAHPGHPDEHHCHEEDWQTGAALAGSPRWVGEAGWPTLGAFIERVASWYWEHQAVLPAPDSYPELDLRKDPLALEDA